MHSQGVPDEQIATLLAYPFPVDGDTAWAQMYDVTMPSERIDLYSDDATIQWNTDLRFWDGEEYDYIDHFYQDYQAGQRYEKHWNAAPIGPVARPVFAFGYLFATVSPFSSSSLRHFTYPSWDGVEATTTLTKNGEVVGTSDDPSGGLYELPAESATYELTTTATRDVEWSTLATEVEATWKVTAGPGENGRLPFLALRTSGEVDELNRAPANRPFRLKLDVERADGVEADVRAVDLEVSFDNGESWKRVRTRPSNSGFTALVPRPPKGSEFVSLRASIDDADGSELEQTVIRAYKLAR